MLTELLMHGWDLAQARGRPWPIGRTQAVACLRGVLPAIVVATDPRVARTETGTYHLRMRGGDDWAFEVRDGAVTVAWGRKPWLAARFGRLFAET